MYKQEYRGLIRAIARVYLHDRHLMALAGRLRDYYVHGAVLPPDAQPFSEALRCVRNGAHDYLEKVFAEIKGLGRRNVPVRMIEHWLSGPADRLLGELRNIAKLLPSKLQSHADALRRQVESTRDVEMAATNLILDRSGLDADAPEQEWCMRLNKMLRDMKRCFNANAMAFDDIEVALERMRNAATLTRKPVRRRRADGAQALRRKDVADIRKEVLRRHEAQVKAHRTTSVKRVLELLYTDDAWSRRCRQWRVETLYQYVIES